MTIDLHGSIGASSAKNRDWKSLCWDKIRRPVRRLQMRIAKAIREKRHGKARALQWLLTHSRSAKLLAVKRVTENKGHRTPGIDKKVWRTDRQKFQAVNQLRRRGYHPQPLRRIYIKKTMKMRIIRALSLTLFIYGFAGWFYIVLNAVVHPRTLADPVTHLTPFLREDTFGIISFAVSMVSFFIWRLTKE